MALDLLADIPDKNSRKSKSSDLLGDIPDVSVKKEEGFGSPGDFALGGAEALVNLPGGLANTLTYPLRRGVGLNIPTVPEMKFAPENSAANLGRLASFFVPGGAISGLSRVGKLAEMGQRASRIPGIAGAVSKAADIMGRSPRVTSIAKNALLGGAFAPSDETGLGILLGGAGGAAGEVLSHLSKMSPSLLSALARTGAGAGAGYIVGENTGVGGKTGAALGAGALLGIPGLAKTVGMGSEKPGLETLEHLNKSEVMPTLEAGRRIGTPLTPAEASGNPYVASMEGQYSRTGASAAARTNIEKERLSQQEKSINSFLDKVYEPTAASEKAIGKAYDAAYEHAIPESEALAFKDNDIINSAIKDVKSNPEFTEKLKSVDQNSLEYWDLVKQAMDDNISSHLSSGRSKQAMLAQNARSDLVKKLDEVSGDTYKNARQLAQPRIIRDELEKKLGTGSLTGANFYRKILANNNNFGELSEKLKNLPEAQAHLNDMKMAWEHLLDMAKPKTSAMMARTSTSAPREVVAKLYDMWSNLVGQKQNIAALKFIHGSEWEKGFEEIEKMTNKQSKMQALAGLVGRAFTGRD